MLICHKSQPSPPSKLQTQKVVYTCFIQVHMLQGDAVSQGSPAASGRIIKGPKYQLDRIEQRIAYAAQKAKEAQQVRMAAKQVFSACKGRRKREEALAYSAYERVDSQQNLRVFCNRSCRFVKVKFNCGCAPLSPRFFILPAVS